MNSLGSYITSFTMYKFIKDITTPFTSFPAYKLGIIDANGIKIKEPKTGQEQQAYSPYYQMIINVKKIFGKVPDPKTRAQLQSVITALKLFGEETEKIGGDGKSLIEGIDIFFAENGINLKEEKIDLMFEDAPANSMGAGAFGANNMNLSPDPVSRSNAIAGFDSLPGYEGFGKGIPQSIRRDNPLHRLLKRRKKKKNARKSTDN